MKFWVLLLVLSLSKKNHLLQGDVIRSVRCDSVRLIVWKKMHLYKSGHTPEEMPDPEDIIPCPKCV